MCTFTLNVPIYNLFCYNFSQSLKTCLHLNYVAGSNLIVFSEVPTLVKLFLLDIQGKNNLLSFLRQKQDFYFIQDVIIYIFYLNSTEKMLEMCVPLVSRQKPRENSLGKNCRK